MTRILSIIAIASALALTSVAFAQGRHDEKAHGSQKPAAKSDAVHGPRATGRHDEKPHGEMHRGEQAPKAPAQEKK